MVHHSGVLRDLGITAVFRDAWSTYRKVVTHNYLHHEEMIAAFAQQLRERPAGDRVLDIGCGDCWLPIHIFSLPGETVDQQARLLCNTASRLLQMPMHKATARLQRPTSPPFMLQACQRPRASQAWTPRRRL